MKTKVFFVAMLFYYLLPIDAIAQTVDLGSPISKQLNQQLRLDYLELPSFDVENFKKENSSDKDAGFLFAKPFDVKYTTENSGTWMTTEEGRLWQVAFRSTNAFSLNLTLSDFKIPDGAVVYVYTPNYKQIAGPFTDSYNVESGILPIQPLAGSEIILEYYEPKDAKFAGKFVISRIAHDYTDILGVNNPLSKFGDSNSCNECINANSASAWQDEKRSVAMIIKNNNRVCSGALINGYNNSGGGRYFLTANHCISSSSYASNLVFMFNYENACDGNDGATYMVVNGSSRIAFNDNTDDESDFCLLQLNSRVPSSYRPYFAGFSRSTSAPQDGIGIHHPRGDVKKFNKENQTLTSSDFAINSPNAAGRYWRVNNWDTGITEGGSSGSPLFDQNSRIVGQLRGGDGVCNGISLYGKFSFSWDGLSNTGSQLKHWLGAGSNPFTVNGYSPPGWRHGVLGGWGVSSSKNPDSNIEAITVGEGNHVFYRRDSDNKICTWYWSGGTWYNATITGSTSSHKAAGDVEVGEGNQIFYRGNDGRIQTYYYSGGWNHGWVDDNWSTSAYKISSSCGALAVGDGNQLFYKGTDNKMHRYYWTSTSGWVHQSLPYSSSNWKVSGDIECGKGDQVFYRGADGKMQTYYKSGSNWYHAYLSTTEQVSSACGAITVEKSNNTVYLEEQMIGFVIFIKQVVVLLLMQEVILQIGLQIQK